MDIQVQKVAMNLKVNKIEKCSEMKRNVFETEN